MVVLGGWVVAYERGSPDRVVVVEIELHEAFRIRAREEKCLRKSTRVTSKQVLPQRWLSAPHSELWRDSVNTP